MQAKIKTSSDAPVHDAFRVQQAKLPIAGKIRPGIMVLTKAAAEKIPNARKIYADGVAAGLSFEKIEQLLKQSAGSEIKKPLTPKNCDYFRCNQIDFIAPGAAAAILEKYGEDRGHGKLLYSFPVVFPLDTIQHVFRQQFEAWNSRALQFWSEPDTQGNLQCMHRPEIKADQSRRKRFGGRPVEVVGLCDPNQCDTFGKGACSHHATLCFYVPGCPGVGLIELSFTSIYAAMGIQQTLEMVRGGLGRIKGVLNGDPIFRISKRNENVSRIDWETGKAERSQQWIIRLEAVNVDMTSVFIAEERRANALPAPAPATTTMPAVIPAQSMPPLNNAETYIDHDDAPVDDDAAVEVEHAEAAFDAETQKQTIASLRKTVSVKADQLKITALEIGAWGKGKYGETAFTVVDTLDAIIGDLDYAIKTGDVSAFKANAPF